MDEKGPFVVRRAKVEDIKYVHELIQELADFEKMSDGPNLTIQDLIRDGGLDGSKEFCHIYIIEAIKVNMDAPIPIGYSICFFSYSTWQGKSYFIEDLYIKPNHRRTGAGTFLFRELARIAAENGCKRVDFHVLAWNPARKFYEKMGAVDLTETEDWHFYRL